MRPGIESVLPALVARAQPTAPFNISRFLQNTGENFPVIVPVVSAHKPMWQVTIIHTEMSLCWTQPTPNT